MSDKPLDAQQGAIRKQRRTPPERRKTLLEATLGCIAKVGLEKTSIRTIADAAGVSVGLINHHFGSKEILIAEAYRHVAIELFSHIETEVAPITGDPREKLRVFIQTTFSPLTLNPDLFRILLEFWTMHTETPAIAAVHNEVYGGYRSMIESMFADLEKISSNSVLTPRLAALGLTGLLDGLWLEWCLEPTDFSPEEGVRLANVWVDAIFPVSASARPTPR